LIGRFEDGCYLRDAGIVVEYTDLVVRELRPGAAQLFGGDELVHGH
jgi:hypothetical protein